MSEKIIKEIKQAQNDIKNAENFFKKGLVILKKICYSSITKY